MNALDSLSKTLESFVNNEYGLAEQVPFEYTDIDGNQTPDVRAVSQYKAEQSFSRTVESDTLKNENIFLVYLDFEPRKNDRLSQGSKVYYVDYFTKVGIGSYRIYTTENSQTIPSYNNRQEI